jgi:translocator protein
VSANEDAPIRYAFWKRSFWAGGLLAPYLMWVSFAAVLNVAIWRMNAA